jgi:hypothetical protein
VVDTVFYDNTFNLANYSAPLAVYLVNMTPADYMLSQCGACGPETNPAIQLVLNITDPIGGEVLFVLLNNTWIWNPATQGGIGGINSSISRRIASTTFEWGGGGLLIFNLAVRQNGQYYVAFEIASYGFEDQFDTGWQVLSSTTNFPTPGLQASDFALWDSSTGSFDYGSNPDFSGAGAEITFGLMLGAETNINAMFTDYSDDWYLEIFPGPLPAPGFNNPSPTYGGAVVSPKPCAVPPISSKLRASLQDLLKRKKKALWPYEWEFPVSGSRLVRASNSIPAPSEGTETAVLSYTVPEGYSFILTHVLQQYQGSDFIPGSGSIQWTIDVNNSLLISLIPQGNTLQGFVNEVVPLGSFELGPWELEMPEFLDSGDVLQSKVITGPPIPTGDPNYFTSMFLGWIVPAF